MALDLRLEVCTQLVVSVIIAENLTKSYGARSVLLDVGLVIQPGERVGLLGANGSGKSTLAKILAGVAEPDSGHVQRQKGATIGYFAQEPELDKGHTVLEAVSVGLGPWQEAYEDYQRISALLEERTDDHESLLARQEQASATVERLGGWERTHLVESVLENLGVTRRDALVGELSGGERRRVALARMLVSEPSLAIVDEPTNHLDIETIEWLEDYLTERFKGALLFITHDRYLLDRVAHRILELDDGTLSSYRGGWESYLEAKAERKAHAARTEANRQNYLRHELDWLSRSPKARTTKQKARIKRVLGVVAQGGPAPKVETAQLQVQESRAGRTIIDIEKLHLTIEGNVLIQELDLCLAKGERIGIVGRNGTGKTSLLRAIVGELPIAGGTIKLGETMRVGYFEQARANLDANASIFENVIGNRGDIQVGGERITANAYLGRFQFSPKRVRDPVGKLSGGERARVALAKLLVDEVNLLLLDEPTNDLDVATLSALEDMLVQTSATALVVTHDRYFLDRVVTGVLAFEGHGQVRRYASAFQARRGGESARKKETTASEKEVRTRPASAKTKLTYAERIELDGLMDAVDAAESEVAEIEAALADPSLYAERAHEVKALSTRLDQGKQKLQNLVDRWEFLENKKARA